MHINNKNEFHKIQHRLCLNIFYSTLFHCFKNFCHYSLKWFHEKWKCYLHLTLGNSTDCSLPGSSVHGILWAKILEWRANPFSRGLSRPRDQTQVSHIAGRLFTIWATMEALGGGCFLLLLFLVLVSASWLSQMVKNLPEMWEKCVWCQGRKDPLERGKATHSSILA